MGTPAKGKACKGMEGLIAQGEEVLEEGRSSGTPRRIRRSSRRRRKSNTMRSRHTGPPERWLGRSIFRSCRAPEQISGARGNWQLDDAGGARVDVRITHRNDEEPNRDRASIKAKDEYYRRSGSLCSEPDRTRRTAGSPDPPDPCAIISPGHTRDPVSQFPSDRLRIKPVSSLKSVISIHRFGRAT
jgi:hypothetical protein